MASIEYVIHLIATWTSIVDGISFIIWGYNDNAISEPSKGSNLMSIVNTYNLLLINITPTEKKNETKTIIILNFYFLNSINYIIKLNNLKIIYYYNVTSKILHIAIT